MSIDESIAAMHKPWLTMEEAAFFCGVSLSQFKAKRNEVGLNPRRFMGKLLFSREELLRKIGESWQASTGADGQPISTGVKAANVTASPLGQSRSKRPRRRDALRILNSLPVKKSLLGG